MRSSLLIIIIATFAAAKTDLQGCTSSTTKDQWGEASMIWWVPGTGEICDFLDCGGGRAPPKTTVPGCPLYSGTATYSPLYMTGNHAVSGASTAASTTSYSVSQTSASKAMITGSQSTTAAIHPSTVITSSVLSSPSGSGVSTSSVPSTITTAIISGGNTTSGGAGATSSSSAGIAVTSGNAGNVNTVHGIMGALVAGFAFFV
ncbi:hypothetical protein G7Y89_g13988 [Cudoniella acicularis]|uniref:Uncharacterized protein n=1 Tax=Cudoniella acicularis TaxID=354080 RepID=A0A8H4R887_9HELO|nr:hypothetical protein G7Y89_g13988 [Cudoniella acicularis]